MIIANVVITANNTTDAVNDNCANEADIVNDSCT